MDTLSDRWLILEQDSDCRDWCSASCNHLTWHGSTITPGTGLPSHSPAEQEICILFLPVRHSSWILPETFSNLNRWQWNVWCHYGRDITMAELKQRWRTYERLAEPEKARLSRDAIRPPLPFSRSMPQPWSHHFRQLKQMVRQHDSLSADSNADSFRLCLNLLKRARMLATGHQDTQDRLDQASEALPAVLAARYLLGVLPKGTGADAMTPREMLKQALDLCQRSGLLAMAHRKERFSGRVREAYRHLGWIVVRLHVLQEHPDQVTQGIADLERLRWALQALLNAANDEATTTSQSLMKHP